MRIRMKGDISGTRNGQDWPPRGGELDLPDDEAAALCAAGMAEPVPNAPVETATTPARDEKRPAPRSRKT